MKLNGPEVRAITDSWHRISDLRLDPVLWQRFDDYFKVINKNGDCVSINNYRYWFKDPHSSKIAFKVPKSYWAKGRKMKIESKLEGIPSGEYLITYKAPSNSYDKEDFVVVEFSTPELTTPRKTLNWLERRIAELEAIDGLTTDKIIETMKIRG